MYETTLQSKCIHCSKQGQRRTSFTQYSKGSIEAEDTSCVECRSASNGDRWTKKKVRISGNSS